MKGKRDIPQIISQLLKLFSLAFLSAFFIFVINHYYQVKNYAEKIYKGLNIFVFFDESSQDHTKILEKLGGINSLSVEEYANTSEAYKKTVEKNPLLNNISLPEDAKFLQPYAVVKPKKSLIPDNNFLLKMKNNIKKIEGINEIVFNGDYFLHCAKIMKQLLLYEKMFLIFIIVIFTFFVLKFILLYTAGIDIQKIIMSLLLYLLSSFLGFLSFLSVCKCINYNITVSKTAVVLITLLICTLGTTFDTSDKK
ncbi:MAG: hypothetical protein LBL71_04800 [Endomicrobium sp.]|jgi:hypothetical protein|nr:hypothetical protein [Endomicrobium sp.]